MQNATPSFDSKKGPLARTMGARLDGIARRTLSFASVTALAFTTAFAPLSPLGFTTQAHAQARAAQSYLRIDPTTSHEPQRVYLGLNKSLVVAEIQRSVVKQLGIQSGVTNPGGTGADDSIDGFGFGVFGAGSFSEQVLNRTSASLGIEAGVNRLS
ncbi:MAG: hypothetical protein AAFU56_10250, partial [Pseudomonadota bacterium]